MMNEIFKSTCSFVSSNQSLLLTKLYYLFKDIPFLFCDLNECRLFNRNTCDAKVILAENTSDTPTSKLNSDIVIRFFKCRSLRVERVVVLDAFLAVIGVHEQSGAACIEDHLEVDISNRKKPCEVCVVEVAEFNCFLLRENRNLLRS